ncbi:unnamed protein product [Urochloa decumbens]|uniref:Uncharacterized protein n=1 Tax=Urochloa decumbens TaxID=240449 RepID=A0ABC9DJ17_9POAL
MGGHGRLFPMRLLLCTSLLFISPSVSSSSLLSFNVHFSSQWGYDPQEVLFHQISPKNRSLHESSCEVYTGHQDKVVLRRKKKKNFVPKVCDCSRMDGLMYGRPALLRVRDKAIDEVASFKMTMCLRVDREAATSSTAGRTGLFLFLAPYPFNRNDEGIEVGLDSACTDQLFQSSLGSDPVVCAHVHYESAEELLKTSIRIGDRSCLCGKKIERRRMPNEAAVGFASKTAGDPIKLENILTWSFHSTLESNVAPLFRPPGVATGAETETESSTGEQQVRWDPWNRNAELNFQYRRNWQQNWQLTCSISVSLRYGNGNEGTD